MLRVKFSLRNLVRSTGIRITTCSVHLGFLEIQDVNPSSGRLRLVLDGSRQAAYVSLVTAHGDKGTSRGDWLIR